MSVSSTEGSGDQQQSGNNLSSFDPELASSSRALESLSSGNMRESSSTMFSGMVDSAAQLSPEDEEFFAMSIFELGLRYSSPKILMSMLPDHEHLDTERIKSHLQKFRIRSKEEFLNYYENSILNQFKAFKKRRIEEASSTAPDSSSSNHQQTSEAGNVKLGIENANDQN